MGNLKHFTTAASLCVILLLLFVGKGLLAPFFVLSESTSRLEGVSFGVGCSIGVFALALCMVRLRIFGHKKLRLASESSKRKEMIVAGYNFLAGAAPLLVVCFLLLEGCRAKNFEMIATITLFALIGSSVVLIIGVIQIYGATFRREQ